MQRARGAQKPQVSADETWSQSKHERVESREKMALEHFHKSCSGAQRIGWMAVFFLLACFPARSEGF